MANSPAGAGREYDSYNQAHWLSKWGSLQPGQAWDAGCSAPIVAARARAWGVAGKAVLVPGCGRGYDAVAFARAGAALSLGVDLAQAAVDAAEAEAARLLAGEPEAAARVRFVAADFFSYEPGRPLDVGFDYTFLCALHPDMRRDWAAAWARLLAPGGSLVTLMFPVGGAPPGAPACPPWPVSPDLYAQLLLPAGFEQVSLERVPAALSHKPRAGREWLGVWRRRGSGGSSAGGGGGGGGSSKM